MLLWIGWVVPTLILAGLAHAVVIRSYVKRGLGSARKNEWFIFRLQVARLDLVKVQRPLGFKEAKAEIADLEAFLKSLHKATSAYPINHINSQDLPFQGVGKKMLPLDERGCKGVLTIFNLPQVRTLRTILIV